MLHQRPLRLSLPAIMLVFLPGCLFALERETVPAFALRVQKALGENVLQLQFGSRWRQDFQNGERSIVNLSLGRERGPWEWTGAYNFQFDRSVPGKEHRLWQQLRYTFELGSGALASSARLEERYFTDSGKAGMRLRVLNRWSHPVGERDSLRLGYEWVYNITDIGNSIMRGVSQNRLITGVSHRLQRGARLEFEYQLRYLHVPARDNRIQHQLQLTYAFSL